MDEAPPTSTPEDDEPRRLVRSREDRVISGLSAGVADQLGVDPVLIRLAFVILTFAGGVGLLVYAAGLLLVPNPGEAPLLSGRSGSVPRRALVLGGFVLLGIGVVAVIGQVGIWFDGGIVWALALLVVGGVLLMRRSAPKVPVPAAVPPTPDGGEAAGEPGAGDDTRSEDAGAPPAAGAAAMTTQAWADPPPPAFAAAESGVTRAEADVPTVEAAVATAEAAVPPAEARVPGPTFPTRFGLGIVLLACGLAGVLAAADVVSLPWDVFLAGLLIAIGVLLVIGAFYGGTPWLIVPGVLIALPLGLFVAADVRLEGGAGERRYTPATAAELRSEYRLAAGQLVLDLRTLELAPGRTDLEAYVGLGQLIVRVPADARVEVDGRTGAGELRILGREDEGFDVERSEATGGGSSILALDAGVGMGSLQVRRAGETLFPENQRGPRSERRHEPALGLLPSFGEMDRPALGRARGPT